MTNELSIINNQPALAHLAAVAQQAQEMRLLKFVKGVWGVGDEVPKRNLWLVPARDAIYFVVWLASFGSNRIRWGSVEYAIRKGRMIPMARREQTAS